MNLTYSLKITGLERKLEDGVVIRVLWTKTATDENGIFADFNARTEFKKISDEESFVPYEKLTEEIVTSWILADPRYESCNAVLAERVMQNSIATSLVEEPQFPWVTSPKPENT